MNGISWAIEFFVVFGLVLLAIRATIGFAHLASLNPHPLWVPVLLLACQHGTAAGVAAALASTAVHWIAGPAPAASGEDLYDYLYRAWREPMLWLVAAVVLGGFRRQHVQKMEALRRRLVAADERLASVGEHAHALRHHCEELERHIACTDDRSIEAGLSVLDEIRRASFEELQSVLPRAVDLLLGAASYSVLTLRDGRLVPEPALSRCALDSSSPARMEQLPSLLVQALERTPGPRVLSIRNADDLEALGGCALLAASVHATPGGRLEGALLVHTIDPMRLTAASECNISWLARELSHALGRDRVVVAFQRDRLHSRTQGAGLESDVAGKMEHVRASTSGGSD